MYFFTDGFAFRLREAAQSLFYRFSIRVNIECVLSEFPGNACHVGWLPCKNLPALTEELDERAFLCFSKVIQHVNLLRQVHRVDLCLGGLCLSVEFVGCFLSSIIDWLRVVDSGRERPVFVREGQLVELGGDAVEFSVAVVGSQEAAMDGQWGVSISGIFIFR